MTITAVQVTNFLNPIELQEWYNNHPNVIVKNIILVNINIFLIFYE